MQTGKKCEALNSLIIIAYLGDVERMQLVLLNFSFSKIPPEGEEMSLISNSRKVYFKIEMYWVTRLKIPNEQPADN